MPSTRARRIAFVAILAACAMPSHATLTTYWSTVQISAIAIAQDPTLGNMQTWDLSVTTTGDWGSAGFEAILPAGHFFYNHPFGGNTRPNPALIAAFPALTYDTYVTAPMDSGVSGAPIILGQFPPAGGSADFGGTSGRFSVLWGDLVPDAPGSYEILRLTFPLGVLPEVNQFSFATQTNPTAAGPAGINLGPPGQKYPPKTWLPDSDGDWNDPSNWDSGSLPTLRQRVLLDVGGPTVRTITHASGNTELHELRSFERVVISGGSLATYVTEINGELLIHNGGRFRPQGLNHLTGSGVVDVSTGGNIVIGNSSALAVGSGLTLRGTGGAVVGGILFNNGGRIVAEGPADVLPIQGFVSLQSGQIGGDGAVRISGPVRVDGSNSKIGTGALRVDGSFTISTNRTLNMAGGSVIHDYTGASSFDDIRAKIINGYNNGAWNGTGINSSTAAADNTLAVGYAEASALFTSFPAVFAGETIDDTTVLVRLVKTGDADLDGTIGLSDFNRLAASFGGFGFWSHGDFNFDLVVNLSDFNLLAANFGISASPDGPTPDDWSALGAAVPEPAVGWVIFLTTCTNLRRRRG